MSPLKPMLGDLELQQVQRLETEGDQLLVQHRVPGLEGDFLQGLGRRGSHIALTGVLSGTESGEGLKKLREKFKAAELVPFVSDIATATKVDKVLIEGMEVRELAGKPERFEYAFALREHTPPPAEESEEPPPADPDISEEGKERIDEVVDDISRNLGSLEVQVTVSSGSQSLEHIVVLVEGVDESGNRASFLLEEQSNGVYVREDVPAGRYTFRAFWRET